MTANCQKHFKRLFTEQDCFDHLEILLACTDVKTLFTFKYCFHNFYQNFFRSNCFIPKISQITDELIQIPANQFFCEPLSNKTFELYSPSSTVSKNSFQIGAHGKRVLII